MSPFVDPTVLKRISSRMFQTAQRFPHCIAAPSAEPQEALSLELSLPPPQPIASQLIALGVGSQAAAFISAAFVQAVRRAKSICETDFQARCQSRAFRRDYFRDTRSTTSLATTYKLVYIMQVGDWTSYVLNNVTPRVLQVQAHRIASLHDTAPDRQRKRPFNHMATPMLEAYFSKNPFPSRLEKSELALTCDMDYRQIHVWFQNRRSRCRKEGKEVKKPVSSANILEELERSVVDALMPPDPDEDLEESVCGVLSAISSSTFPSRRPPHAYPSPYPPLCSYDPFPESSEARALQLPWIRQLSSNVRHCDSEITVGCLVAAFERLSLSSVPDETPPERAPVRTSALPIGFLTRCCPAPHPALRRPACSPIGPLPQHRLRPTRGPTAIRSSDVRRGISLESLDSLVTCTSEAGSTQPLNVAELPYRSKRRLPRRVPCHPPNRQLYPTMKDQADIALPIAVRSPSSSSSGSDADSPLPTPRLFPIASLDGTPLSGNISYNSNLKTQKPDHDLLTEAFSWALDA